MAGAAASTARSAAGAAGGVRRARGRGARGGPRGGLVCARRARPRRRRYRARGGQALRAARGQSAVVVRREQGHPLHGGDRAEAVRGPSVAGGGMAGPGWRGRRAARDCRGGSEGGDDAAGDVRLGRRCARGAGHHQGTAGQRAAGRRRRAAARAGEGPARHEPAAAGSPRRAHLRAAGGGAAEPAARAAGVHRAPAVGRRLDPDRGLRHARPGGCGARPPEQRPDRAARAHRGPVSPSRDPGRSGPVSGSGRGVLRRLRGPGLGGPGPVARGCARPETGPRPPAGDDVLEARRHRAGRRHRGLGPRLAPDPAEQLGAARGHRGRQAGAGARASRRGSRSRGGTEAKSVGGAFSRAGRGAGRGTGAGHRGDLARALARR